MTEEQAIESFFQRPNEPVFTPKDGGKVSLVVPESFLSDRYKQAETDLQSRFGGNDVEIRIPILEIQQPDISFATVIPKDRGFSLFIKKHAQIAGRLVKILVNLPNRQSFISVLAYAKDRLNPYLFQYALSCAVAHRKDTKNIKIPSIVQVFPDQFIDPAAFPELRQETNLVSPEKRKPVAIDINFTATDREEEQRIAYWREDIGVNAHHWHWHLVYPSSGDRSIVAKDRRGELFYYMHSQVMARYNVERYAAKLASVKRFNNFRDVIPEGYFPKMVRSSSNRAYPPRASGSVLVDLNRDETNVSIADLERWRDQIYEAIDQGSYTNPNGSKTRFTEEKGIDVLGDIIEASDLSPNPVLYGNLHNEGHNILAFLHDPDNRHLEDYGVIGDNTTAMRDPVFYKWHAFIESIFVRYKLTLPQYTDPQLVFTGINIKNVQVQLRGNTPSNVLLTYWQKSQVDLQAGLDFGPQGNAFVEFTHLQHAPFTYRITVENSTGETRRGTCRIFIGPKTDERGTPLAYREQRLLMIELDKFNVDMTPGSNTITRRSDESNVTIPFERTFRPVGTSSTPTDATQRAQFEFCGCGWPQHMLVPKGTPEGMSFDIFVMISDFTLDTVNQNYNENENCNDAASFCGLRDLLYPDRRAMGYPFDRRSSNDINTLAKFAAKGTNMLVGTIQVKFSNTIVNRTA